MTYRRAHDFWDPIVNSEKSKHLTYNFYPFIYANTRLLQRPFSVNRVLTVYQKSSSSRSSRSLEKDTEGLKRKEKFKGLKKRRVSSWKLYVVYT